jgi:hypothetical protein
MTAKQAPKPRRSNMAKYGTPGYRYTEAIAEEIFTRLMMGESLLAICRDEGMPDRVTVVDWCHKDPDFAERYWQARQAQADLMDDMLLEIAKNSKYETSAADAVKSKILMWRAKVLNNKRYGDKTEAEITQSTRVTHIHLVAPDQSESVLLDGDFTMLPHPLEQE